MSPFRLDGRGPSEGDDPRIDEPLAGRRLAPQPLSCKGRRGADQIQAAHQTELISMAAAFDLKQYEIDVAHIDAQRPGRRCCMKTPISRERAAIADSGALIIRSGAKTGRSPLDKRIVDHPDSTANIWWGPVNIRLAEAHFRHQPPAGDRLPEHPRHDLRARRFRRLGPAISRQDPRDLRGPIMPCSCTTCCCGPRRPNWPISAIPIM